MNDVMPFLGYVVYLFTATVVVAAVVLTINAVAAVCGADPHLEVWQRMARLEHETWPGQPELWTHTTDRRARECWRCSPRPVVPDPARIGHLERRANASQPACRRCGVTLPWAKVETERSHYCGRCWPRHVRSLDWAQR